MFRLMINGETEKLRGSYEVTCVCGPGHLNKMFASLHVAEGEELEGAKDRETGLMSQGMERGKRRLHFYTGLRVGTRIGKESKT